MKKKIIWLDVGTHYAQEFESFFGSYRSFFFSYLKSIYKKIFFSKGRIINIKELMSLLKFKRIALKSREIFFVIFVEPNFYILNKSKNYLKANCVFNLALLKRNSNRRISKLFLVKNNMYAQGNSVYSNKDNVNKNDYIFVNSISSNSFLESLKLTIDKEFSNYEIFLRINCEGSEDEVIYECKKIFGKKFNTIFGTIVDTKRVKGVKKFNQLKKFIKKNNLDIIFFSSGIESWYNAHNSIIKKL